MRLTLRTMLAYLDDRLEPADAEALGAKIAESKFASSLVHRIRNCTRRLRLGCPPLEGRGLGRDANTVAEYLNNTLSQDHVPEFEKICLESDVHLAEVASCHQILTMVLEEPREVDPALRERIFLLNHPRMSRSSAVKRGPETAEQPQESPLQRQDGTLSSTTSGPTPSGALAASGGASGGVAADGRSRDGHRVAASSEWDESRDPRPTERRLEVPDYLRTPPARTSRLVPVLGTLVLTFVLATIGLLAMGPLNRNHPLLGLLLGESPATVSGRPTESDEPVSGDPAEAVVDASGADASGADASGADASGRPDEMARPNGPEGTGSDLEGTGSEPAASAGPSPEPQLPGGEPIKPPAGEAGAIAGGDLEAELSRLPRDPPRIEPDPSAPAMQLPGEPAVLPPVRPPAGPLFPSPERSTDSPAIRPVTGEERVGGPRERPVGPSQDGPGVGGEVGRMISESQVLLRYQDQDETWMRVGPFALLSAGDRFIGLPTFRPQFLLSSGLKVTLAGESNFRLGAGNGLGSERLEITYGRALLLMVGKAGTQLHLDLGGRPGLITLRDLDSALAIEVRRYLPPGANPEEDPAWMVTQLFATSGRFDWQDGEVPRPEPDFTVAAGQVMVLEADQPPRLELAKEFPVWVDSRAALTPIDRKTSEVVEPILVTDRPATLTLMELTEHRQTDVRALAARCLGHLGSYDALVEQLGDERQKAYWDDIYQALRDAVARDPEQAGQVRIALERKWPEQAPTLYRLLWGYQAQQLEAGSAEQLVALLENPLMSVRVVAFLNLKGITGGMTQLFRPETGVAEERSKVLRWRERLKEGAIRYAVPPQPVPPRQAVGPVVPPPAVPGDGTS